MVKNKKMMTTTNWFPRGEKANDGMHRMNFLNRRTSNMTSRDPSTMIDSSSLNMSALNPNEKYVFDKFMKGVGYESHENG